MEYDINDNDQDIETFSIAEDVVADYALRVLLSGSDDRGEDPLPEQHSKISDLTTHLLKDFLSNYNGQHKIFKENVHVGYGVDQVTGHYFIYLQNGDQGQKHIINAIDFGFLIYHPADIRKHIRNASTLNSTRVPLMNNLITNNLMKDLVNSLILEGKKRLLREGIDEEELSDNLTHEVFEEIIERTPFFFKKIESIFIKNRPELIKEYYSTVVEDLVRDENNNNLSFWKKGSDPRVDKPLYLFKYEDMISQLLNFKIKVILNRNALEMTSFISFEDDASAFEELFTTSFYENIPYYIMLDLHADASGEFRIVDLVNKTTHSIINSLENSSPEYTGYNVFTLLNRNGFLKNPFLKNIKSVNIYTW